MLYIVTYRHTQHLIRGIIIMMLYSRCTNVIREIRYVGKYYSINEYQCYNKTISGRCNSCESENTQ